MRDLELLAPARNADIGIAAIDCGADAVYLAGPEFGARQSAGNSMEDVRRLCEYAHRYGVRIFLTLNTILFDNELISAERLLQEAKNAGVDAIIAQDLAVGRLTDLPVHASTQCAIRTPEKARFYESLGAARLVLERELSLDQIKAIRDAISCELEFFVHGALCVCYSGQCYLSEQIAGRSANRGACIQACRSLYDLVDASGKTLVKNKALLSLKDYNLRGRLDDLAGAGICSFKIEGRLKNISYVRNVVKAYSVALDNLVAKYPHDFRRVSFGRSDGGFRPDLDKTFNRGYTKLYLDGKQGRWSSMDAPKSMGEEVGIVSSVSSRNGKSMELTVRLNNLSGSFHNGDGFSFIAGDEIIGFRGDVCQGSKIQCKPVPGISVGTKLFRNLDTAFEKELESNLPVRLIPVSTNITIFDRDGDKWLDVKAMSQDGREVAFEWNAGRSIAENVMRIREMFNSQIAKVTGRYSFSLDSVTVKTDKGRWPFLSASALNGIRRLIASRLESMQCKRIPLGGKTASGKEPAQCPAEITYKDNVSNHLSRELYASRGAATIEDAFEITHRKDAELMRTRYCIKQELGLCPVHQGARDPGPLFLLNNGKRYPLHFDCKNCEMTVLQDRFYQMPAISKMMETSP